MSEEFKKPNEMTVAQDVADLLSEESLDNLHKSVAEALMFSINSENITNGKNIEVIAATPVIDNEGNEKALFYRVYWTVGDNNVTVRDPIIYNRDETPDEVLDAMNSMNHAQYRK